MIIAVLITFACSSIIFLMYISNLLGGFEGMLIPGECCKMVQFGVSNTRESGKKLDGAIWSILNYILLKFALK